ncbi:MAG: UDP-N-acetylmuramoyl-L-alanine--D-glutamate ligase [Clostridia bacterium]|nr:UDP-N-acetylmuramoyl-L-alanine--D-glutamate ligase [Clostridia bacterium]
MENININNVKGKKVLVVGLGKSGIAAIQAMVKLGACVTVQDSKTADKIDRQLLTFLKDKGVEMCLGNTPDISDHFDMMILSPGVDPQLPFVQNAQKQGTEIIGELEIAYRLARGNFVALTGTNGKTTTTTLTGEIFKKAGRKTHVVGNIGVAVISKALETTEDDWLITETSSFQLETTRYFKPVVSAILNITPDHLNRHHTMENYALAKGKIFENQDEQGYCIVNAEDPICLSLMERSKAKVVYFSSKRELEKGAFVKDGYLVILTEAGELISLCHRDELKIIGVHNVENALAAAAISYYSGIEADVISRVLKEFAGVEHRIEYCGTGKGVRYFNDSKGTNVDAALTAIRAIEKNIILIAGGDGKGQDFTPLAESLKGKVRHMILLGKDGDKIAKAADEAGFGEYSYCSDMAQCVKKAVEIAEPGDTVLLSPACASWDMYENFEQRGNHFKDMVEHFAL